MMRTGSKPASGKAEGKLSNESGQGLVEYVLLAALFSLAVLALSQTFASGLNGLISNLNANLF